jgi:hypothetical protein
MARFNIGSYRFRLSIDAVQRPQYGHLVFNAARLAKSLGYKRISVIEYGVAGGNGLLALEDHALRIEEMLGVEIEVYGFDTGKGLPPPADYRDLPFHWQEGFFAMNFAALEKRLRKAKLVLGDIKETAPSFFEVYKPAPVGAIAIDVDFYSSTVPGLEMLKAGEKYFLPRIFCYFDDTVGSEIELYNDFTGERLAINEFNDANEHIKLCPPYYLAARRKEIWHNHIWIGHFFNHSKYNAFVSRETQGTKLESSAS